MSYRASISEAYVEKLKQDLDGVKYDTNLYGNVSSKLKHIDQINDFPYVSISPGVETREYQPGGIIWGFLNMYIRVFVRSEDEAQEQLEAIIYDLENFIDDNLELEYTIKNVTQYVTEATVESIATDEGLLAPDAVGEITFVVRYERTRF